MLEFFLYIISRISNEYPQTYIHYTCIVNTGCKSMIYDHFTATYIITILCYTYPNYWAHLNRRN